MGASDDAWAAATPVAAPAPADTARTTPRVRPSRLPVGTQNYRPNDLISKGISFLPAAGNIIGDVLGGGAAAAAIPETMGGSALAIPAATAAAGGAGQAAGRAGQLALLQALGYAPPADMNKAGTGADLAGQAGWGAANSLGGRALPWVFRGAAKGLMGSSLQTLDKAAVEAALDEGIRPGKSVLTSKTGSQQVQEAIDAYKVQADKLLADAGKQGVSFRVADVLPRAQELIADAGRADPSKAAELQKVLDDFVSAYVPKKAANSGAGLAAALGKKLEPAAMQTLKQDAAQIATPLYKAINSGSYVGLRAESRAAIYKAIADDARAVLAHRVPNLPTQTPLAELNQSMEPLIGDLQRPMANAEGTLTGPAIGLSGRTMGLQPLNLLPQGVSGQAALTLNSPLMQALAKYGPRAVLGPWMMNRALNQNAAQGGAPQ